MSALEPRADCSLVRTARIPLPDLRNNRYQGFVGALYPGGSATRPAFHEAEGLARARLRIQPLDAGGKPDPARGRIVLISIGMSNTQLEFSRFMDLARSDPAKNPQLVLVNAAQGGQPSTSWTNPDALTWQTAISRVSAEGVTPRQVQVAWIKHAQVGAGPSSPPRHRHCKPIWRRSHATSSGIFPTYRSLTYPDNLCRSVRQLGSLVDVRS